jgi:Flp pilus assembly pilin Flp
VTWLQMLVDELTHRVGDDDGEVTIEYGILVVFVALALIAAAGFLSGSIDGWFDRIGAYISSLSNGSGG